MVRGSKFLVLPHESTLLDYTNYLTVNPGVNIEILKNIAKEADESFRHNVTIIFDEINLYPVYLYAVTE